MKRWTGESRSAACPRTWEIEAARDGRLGEEAKERIDLHAGRCAECRRERDDLDRLARALRALPFAEPDDLAQRRTRQEVLRACDAEIAGRSIPPARRGTRFRAARVAFAVAVACVFAFAFANGWRARHGSEGLPPTSSAGTTVVDAVGDVDSIWSRVQESGVERIDLSAGTLHLRVRRPPNGRRVVVHVPDGEIEDVGTTFHVTVARGRTRSVVVDEGRVSVRLASAAPVFVDPGSPWSSPDSAPPTSVEGTTVDAGPRTSTRDAIPTTSPSLAKGHVPESTVHAVPPTSDSSAPSADSEEDATYLRVVHLAREGRDDDARAAAREYLRKFPEGFRRREMERIGR